MFMDALNGNIQESVSGSKGRINAIFHSPVGYISNYLMLPVG
jgi:hypothetical protein